MARPMRFQYPGAVYHVMAWGDGGKVVFESDDDSLVFLKRLEVNLTSQPSALVVPSFCKFEVGTASRRLNSRWLMMDGTCRTSHRRRRWPRFGLLDPPLRHFTGKARLHQTEHFNALPASGRCPG